MSYRTANFEQNYHWLLVKPLYFMSIRARVKIINMKNCIKNFMVIKPIYFYKASKDKT